MFFTLKNQIILLFFTFESKKVHVVMNSLNLIPQPDGQLEKLYKSFPKH